MNDWVASMISITLDGSEPTETVGSVALPTWAAAVEHFRRFCETVVVAEGESVPVRWDGLLEGQEGSLATIPCDCGEHELRVMISRAPHTLSKKDLN